VFFRKNEIIIDNHFFFANLKPQLKKTVFYSEETVKEELLHTKEQTNFRQALLEGGKYRGNSRGFRHVRRKSKVKLVPYAKQAA